MTAKEAMQIRKNPTVKDVDNDELTECIDEALKKQIPQKPDYEGDGYDESGNLVYDTYYCPYCYRGYETDYDDFLYCPNCGQALDWSDDG